MLFEWLETVRKKPLHTRRFIAFGLSIFITGIIFVIWLGVWFSVYSKPVSASVSEVSPFSGVYQNMSDMYIGVTNQIGILKNVFKDIKLENINKEVYYTSTYASTSEATSSPSTY